MRKVRIGIDVGGTFTDAVVIDNQTGEVIAKAKRPTTHHHEDGVAQGIVEIINEVLTNNNISPEQVVFIAHGTTQATNALLEGDVAKVGIIGMGKSKAAFNELNVKHIELAPGKFLETEFSYFDVDEITKEKAEQAINELVAQGCEVIVASEAYAVDDPHLEKLVTELAREKGLYATSGHEISQLYGLRMRTRTAVVNASLIPKMIETANMTEQVVKRVGIPSELMIMRADGGVMSVNEVRQRPILTMLSGLAAGVAGALMYEKISDGVFFEVGGTSIDISVIKDGKVIVNNAQVGKHKTYLKALDVRTLGIAGGSMIRIAGGKVIDVGPRSAHLADKHYECFVDAPVTNAKLKEITPLPGDSPDHAIITSDQGDYAYTLAGAANILGYVPEDDYAYANVEAARVAWQPLAEYCGKTVEEVARDVMDIACEKIWNIVGPMIKEYEVNPEYIEFVGGGGSAAITTFALGEKYGFKAKTAKNAPYISTIGVAMAMVREQIERSVVDPSSSDIQKIRADIMDQIVAQGAKEESVEIAIEVDKQRNILIATATGATEFSNDGGAENLTEEAITAKVADVFSVDRKLVQAKAQSGAFHIVKAPKESRKLFNLIRKTEEHYAVVKNDGMIPLKLKGAQFIKTARSGYGDALNNLVAQLSSYSDAGQTIPKVYAFTGSRMFDYSGLFSTDQLSSMMSMDLEHLDAQQDVLLVAAKK
ncbi:hydantoinase/oxoprolinase family protein [Photobacterium sp. BZF1]|uniref:hydantoinase/oxoprolinase family protein n=1 Tax=Photobacterium sp. BZF1 TaxID=1904457 RepID=UPI00165379A1|nr:hydantoinase/oxoprolinase family protein [Photobacterium sp. BZF1]MBC7003757.1 hydantoinase/oxoprolinase family protein [Photobacterium sp. BZF1]